MLFPKHTPSDKSDVAKKSCWLPRRHKTANEEFAINKIQKTLELNARNLIEMFIV